MTRLRVWLATTLALAALAACGGDDGPGPPAQSDTTRLAGDSPSLPGGCDELPDAETLRRYTRAAPDSVEVGGLMDGRHEWAAVVNRAGAVCAVVVSSDSAGSLWPGSRTTAMAKAYTANGFSTNAEPLSTARLYSMAQPGGPLYGAAAANPLDPSCLDGTGGEPRVCGGTIAFGGGLPLYRDGRIVGGLGLSGDTPCADHEVAKQVRALAGMAPPAGNFADDITYAAVDGPSPYTHPLCRNTWRNGERIGDAPPVPRYPHDR